jgi:hypothetical protein
VALALGAAAMLIGSCAPRLARPPELARETREQRYRALLSEREARGVAVSANLALWAERGGERLPGAQADLVLASPDRMRLRIASMFGTALDLGLSGDSLRAYIPAWKTGLRLDSVAESLGIDPGDRLVRALSATWRPPADAWADAAWDDSLLRVVWQEGGDSVAIEIGASGLPTTVELSRPRRFSARARYRMWDRASGTPWPVHIEVADETHDVRMACRASQVRFREHVDLNRLVVRWPSGLIPLTLAELRSALDRMGVL